MSIYPSQQCAQFWCDISPLDATLLGPLVCVANKGLAQYLSPLDATLTNCGVCVATKGLTHNLSRLDATLTKNMGGIQIPLGETYLECIATNEESDHIGRGPSCI